MSHTAASSSAGHASWVRVRLTGPRDPQNPNRAPLTEGELVLRADRVMVRENVIVFLCAEEEVFELDRRHFRSMAWFVDRPTFAEWLRSRRAAFPNAHTRWSAEDDATLRREVEAGTDWATIAKDCGRSATSVKRRAAYFGFTASTRSGRESSRG